MQAITPSSGVSNRIPLVNSGFPCSVNLVLRIERQELTFRFSFDRLLASTGSEPEYCHPVIGWPLDSVSNIPTFVIRSVSTRCICISLHADSHASRMRVQVPIRSPRCDEISTTKSDSSRLDRQPRLPNLFSFAFARLPRPCRRARQAAMRPRPVR